MGNVKSIQSAVASLPPVELAEFRRWFAEFHSARIGLYYRALGLPVPGGVHWFWVGTHGEYDKLVG